MERLFNTTMPYGYLRTLKQLTMPKSIKMKKIIDTAIAELNFKGVKPSLINLSKDDYDSLVNEINLTFFKGIDYGDGYIKTLSSYMGIEIDNRLPDIDEVRHPLFTQSFICSSSIYQQSETGCGVYLKQIGRGFNLRTLEEIINN